MGLAIDPTDTPDLRPGLMNAAAEAAEMLRSRSTSTFCARVRPVSPAEAVLPEILVTAPPLR
jgi:hypothetical protein